MRKWRIEGEAAGKLCAAVVGNDAAVVAAVVAAAAVLSLDEQRQNLDGAHAPEEKIKYTVVIWLWTDQLTSHLVLFP